MKHTLHVLVEDTPAVLNRVTSLFRRRAFAIESFTFVRTDEPGISRIVVVLEGDKANIQRLVAYLMRLVEVVRVECAEGEDTKLLQGTNLDLHRGHRVHREPLCG